MPPARALVLGSDHAGCGLRVDLAAWLRRLGHDVVEHGPRNAEERTDYPDVAAAACAELRHGGRELAILVCGTGIGVSLAANALPGVRASVCVNEFMARMGRAHNDINALCLGERVVGAELARAIVEVYLTTAFAGGRHADRLAKLQRLRST